MKEAIKSIIVKTYMHCEQCERDLKQRLIKHKGIHNVNINSKAQTVTIEGVIESEKLISYMRNRVHKHAEIVEPSKGKKEEKEETKEKKKEAIAVGVKSKEEIVEYTEFKKVEAKTKEAEAPYFIHYVYAPQLFSDENPNACTIV
ncbi:hypothetical protein Leryth_024465 [Lithospermum erythrorhizon]|nr:hypothetical protein Leryth_024465 [Lithospermum erythrorhizon]